MTYTIPESKTVLLCLEFDAVITTLTRDLTDTSPWGAEVYSIERKHLSAETEIAEIIEAAQRYFTEDVLDDVDRSKMLVSDASIDFLRKMLSNDKVQIAIISMNSNRYIRAMLEYRGFSGEEIGKILIPTDVQALGDKGMPVHRLLMENPNIKNVYIADPVDFHQKAMESVSHCRNINLNKHIDTKEFKSGPMNWQPFAAAIDRVTDIAYAGVAETVPVTPVSHFATPRVKADILPLASFLFATPSTKADNLPIALSLRP